MMFIKEALYVVCSNLAFSQLQRLKSVVNLSKIIYRPPTSFFTGRITGNKQFLKDRLMISFYMCLTNSRLEAFFCFFFYSMRKHNLHFQCIVFYVCLFFKNFVSLVFSIYMNSPLNVQTNYCT